MASIQDYDRAAQDMRRPGPEPTKGRWDARELIRYGTLAASSHNTQPWKIFIRQDSIVLKPDFSRRCPVVDPDDSHLFKSIGCAAENIVHAAAAQGFSADIGFNPDEESVEILLNHSASAQVTDLFEAIPKRQCSKTTYDGTPLEVSELEKLKESGAGHNVRTILLLSESQKDTVIDYVTQGNIAQLTDRAWRRELVSWIRFNHRDALRTGDGLSGRVGGQPALPTWLAKAIIGLALTAKGQAKTDEKNIKSSAGVAVFVATRNDKSAWIETGRVYERFALQATALDIRTAFINQPIEVQSLRPQFESWLNLDGEHALLMVRFGHGPSAPFSLRRPLDDVIFSR